MICLKRIIGNFILVVDDDVRLRSLLERYLKEQDFMVRTVENAEQMDRFLERENYHLMVLDLMLPGEDGCAVDGGQQQRVEVALIAFHRHAAVEAEDAGEYDRHPQDTADGFLAGDHAVVDAVRRHLVLHLSDAGQHAHDAAHPAHLADLAELLHQVVSAQEHERQRIARELHDSTGQTLTALRIEISAPTPDVLLPLWPNRAETMTEFRGLTKKARSAKRLALLSVRKRGVCA